MKIQEAESVLILGANSDIGKSVAKLFAKLNYVVHLASRNIEELEKFKIKESLFKDKFKIFYLDILNLSEFEKKLESIIPKPTIIISAVGLMPHDTELSNKDESFIEVMKVNYIYPALALEKASNFLKRENKLSTIVGITSVAGDRGRKKNYIYGSSKSGFTQYLSGLRQKLSRTKVNVLTVKLGYVETKMTKHLNLPKFITSNPDEIAKKIVHSVIKRKSFYTPFIWKIIMFLISFIPEILFKKMKF